MINVRCDKHFTAIAMRLTFLVSSMCFGGLSLASNIPREPTNLKITSVHDLTITLTWTKPLTTAGTPISTSLNYKVTYTVIGSGYLHSITVKTESAQLNLQDDKKYNIHVKAIRSDNHRIQSPWSEILTVDSKNLAPGKPTDLTITRRSGMVVYLAWQKPLTTINGIPDTSYLCYKIRYRKLGTPRTMQFSLCTNGGSVPLLANSKYEIDVKAFKLFITRVSGPWSEPLTVETAEHIPSKPPTQVTAVSNTPSSITVRWGRIPESGRSGIIQGYVVFYREESSSSWTERDVKMNRSVELTNLQTGKQYTVCVAGYTKVGRGVKSKKQNIFVGVKTTSTTKQTTKLQLSSKSSTLPAETSASHTPKTAITEPSKRTTVQLISTSPACPQDWTEHGSFCYHVMSTTGRMTETAARQECQKLGADLPILKSAEENSYLLGMMKEYGETWLGMEAKGNNDFKWIDGASVAGTFSAWYPGEPNNPGDENCAYMYVDEKRKGRWNDNPCDVKHLVACQKKYQGYRSLSSNN